MGKANEGMGREIKSLKENFKEVETSRNEEKRRGDTLDAELVNLRHACQKALDENANLKVDIQKSTEEIAGALGEGYHCCLVRVSKVGFEASCQTTLLHRVTQAKIIPRVTEGEGCLVIL